MFAVSYLDRDGQAAGFALIAHRDDAAALERAEEAADRWREALRSRRLLVADIAPLCEGGVRALRMMEDAGNDVFIPAHGAPLDVRAEAAARGLRVVDATCPLVAAVQRDAATCSSRGDTVLIIGRDSDRALPVLATYAEGARIVHDTTEAENLPVPPWHVSFVIEPGMPVDEAMPILTVLRRRFPDLRGHHFDALCEVASDRARAIADVARVSELTLALTGDPDDPEIPAESARITTLADLDIGRLAHATTIGMFSTSSAPADLEDQVIQSLSGLGPLSAKRRGAQTTALAWASSRPTAAFPA